MTNSDAQQWNADDYARNARFVADLGVPLVDLLAPQPHERILDLGCGDGALTAKIAASGCSVVGVDGSAAMIAAAKKLGLDARVADGHALPFTNEFDAVFSNAALHWMKQPAAVIECVARALKPGGRFIAEMGGHSNIAAIIGALERALAARGIRAENPWYFPTPQAYQRLLEDHGFQVMAISLFPRPTPLPGDIRGWLHTFAHAFMSPLPAQERDAFIDEVAEALRPVLSDTQGGWKADYVRLRFGAKRVA